MYIGKRSASIAGVVTALLALLALAPRAHAQTWTATLNGSSVVPSGSPGTGLATVSLNGNQLTVDMYFSGLESQTTASHIHCCTAAPFTGTAGVATTTPTFPGFPLGVTSGTYHDVFDLMLASSYNPAFISAHGGSIDAARVALINGMNAGTTYVNIHTTQFPGGEIAGYLVTTTPEPSSAILLAPGLVVVGGMTRRRRRASNRH